MTFPFPIIPSSAIVGSVSVSLTDTQSTTSTLTNSYTFSGVSIGDAASNRLVVVVLGATYLTGSSTPSTATIGGVSATIHESGTGFAILSAIVPTGTTADISATGFSTYWQDGFVAVFAAYGASATPSWSDQDTNGATTQSSLSLSTSVPSGGFGVMLMRAGNSGASWSHGTEVYEPYLDTYYASIALITEPLSSETVTATRDVGGAQYMRIAGASFGPA